MKSKNKKMLMALAIVLVNSLAMAQNLLEVNVAAEKDAQVLAGAIIQITNTYWAKQADENGKVIFENMPAATYILKTSLLGFESKFDTVDVLQTQVFTVRLKENSKMMDEVVIAATRVSDKSAMAYSNVDKKTIDEQNTGLDLPLLLNQQVSMVTTSDAGAGVGYTGMRIRGSDATRINVTINGVPINDAESQGMYWVDMPDIASSIDNIQVQRGVGSSTNGAGAFGGSINIQTTKLNKDAYASYAGSVGSFNTFKNTVSAGSGLLNNQFAVDARLSSISSNGFIDRAASDLKSYYLSGTYYGKKTILKFITFSGLEKTYQAWNGVPEARLRNDFQGMNDYIIRNGLDDADAANLLQSSSRSYNMFTYQNQIDRYQQNYYQLHFSRAFNNALNLNISLHYTKGFGYYEEYKKNQAFSSYGLENIVIGNQEIRSTNLIRRRWLDNDFYGTVFSLNYTPNNKLSASLGGGYNFYNGLHYGEIIWAQYAGTSTLTDKYYSDTATKKDENVYLKLNYLIARKLNLFADLQVRSIHYDFWDSIIICKMYNKALLSFS
jgi:iron complex outermembrane recepter protein